MRFGLSLSVYKGIELFLIDIFDITIVTQITISLTSEKEILVLVPFLKERMERIGCSIVFKINMLLWIFSFHIYITFPFYFNGNKHLLYQQIDFVQVFWETILFHILSVSSSIYICQLTKGYVFVIFDFKLKNFTISIIMTVLL